MAAEELGCVEGWQQSSVRAPAKAGLGRYGGAGPPQKGVHFGYQPIPITCRRGTATCSVPRGAVGLGCCRAGCGQRPWGWMPRPCLLRRAAGSANLPSLLLRANGYK